MLETRVFALGVLANDGKVDVGMTGGDTGERFAQDDRGVNVELLTHSDIPRYVTGLGDWSKQDAFAMIDLCSEAEKSMNETRTLESNFVAFQALHSLLEESFTRGGHAGDIILLPLYRSVDRLENLFN
jgi:hypothetical protein